MTPKKWKPQDVKSAERLVTKVLVSVCLIQVTPGRTHLGDELGKIDASAFGVAVTVLRSGTPTPAKTVRAPIRWFPETSPKGGYDRFRVVSLKTVVDDAAERMEREEALETMRKRLARKKRK